MNRLAQSPEKYFADDSEKNDDNNIQKWLWIYFYLKNNPLFSLKQILAIFSQKGGSISSTIEEIKSTVLDLNDATRDLNINTQIANEINNCHIQNVKIIPFDSELYPNQLRQISNPPLILFAKGNLDLLKKTKIAIVGSRVASIAAMQAAATFAEKLSMAGFCIVSGFAKGVDTQACKSALKYGTIQIVATGLDAVYPNENIKLFDEVLENNGLFLSEYRLGDNCSRWINVKQQGLVKKLNFTNFPERNRIISAICDRIIIAQANIKNQAQLDKAGIDFLIGSKSGSLNTAYHVYTQNKSDKLFAITGSPIDQSAIGCNALVAKKLAKPIFDINEFIADLLKSA